VLGAVFLATTGAEALYSDLGHCGLKNIRISWTFVKTALLLNYFGQGAWIIHHPEIAGTGINPFFAIMPQWFILPGIIISTTAAIIASQALISGSFTVISEAISLNFWPKMTIKYPTEIKGQLYVPNINIFLWVACLGVVLLFRKSSAMQAAYGLSITFTMMMTTVLLLLYLSKNLKTYLLILLGVVYFTIEGTFLIANLNKFSHGGWFTVLFAGIFTVMMYSWYNGRDIKNSLMTYIPINKLTEILKKVRADKTIPKFATNLVYITKADREHLIESTIVYSLLDKQPKRADIYWFIHINITDEPYAYQYKVTHIVPGIIIKVDFYIGFREESRINVYFRQVLEDLNKTGEIKTESRYPSLREFSITGDRRYVLIDRILTADHAFNIKERLIMNISDIIKILAIPESKSLHLDASNILLEKVPLGKPDKPPDRIRRILNVS
jgi:KUP system potassium uptake protein